MNTSEPVMNYSYYGDPNYAEVQSLTIFEFGVGSGIGVGVGVGSCFFFEKGKP